MKKLACTLACAVALATMAPTPTNRAAEPTPVTRVAVVATSAALPAAAADVSAVSSSVQELTPSAMNDVRGTGFWSKLKDIVKKIAKWIWDNRQWIIQAIEQNTRHETTVQDTYTYGFNKDDHFSQNENQDDYYDATGTLVNSTFAADAEQYQYTDIYAAPGEGT